MHPVTVTRKPCAMVCYGRAWPNPQPFAMVDPCGVAAICKGSLHALPVAAWSHAGQPSGGRGELARSPCCCALAVSALCQPMEPPTGKRGTQENPPKQERAPRRRFGQLGWRLGGREGALGPRALEFQDGYISERHAARPRLARLRRALLGCAGATVQRLPLLGAEGIMHMP